MSAQDHVEAGPGNCRTDQELEPHTNKRARSLSDDSPTTTNQLETTTGSKPSPTPGAILHLAVIMRKKRKTIQILSEAIAKINGKQTICECIVDNAEKFLTKHEMEINSMSCVWGCKDITYDHV